MLVWNLSTEQLTSKAKVIRNLAFPIVQYWFQKIQMHLMSIIGDEHISIFQSKGIVYLIADVIKGYHVRYCPI